MHRQCILVVEDEVDARETLRLLLEMEGFEVVAAGNGREALERLEEIGRPCLILLDLMMPVMSGWEFLEALEQTDRKKLDETPIVIVSAAADIGRTADSRCRRVLTKPFDLEPLVALAKECCAHGEHPRE